MPLMAKDRRQIRRKLRILEHALVSGDVSRTCRYFGIGRASVFRGRQAGQAKRKTVWRTRDRCRTQRLRDPWTGFRLI